MAEKSPKSEMDQIREILRDHDEKPFVKRIIRPKDYPTLDLGGGNFATHQMEYGSVDTPKGTRYWVYPRVQMQGNKLVDFGERAFDRAVRDDDYIEFKDEAKAAWFSRSYKKYWEQQDPVVEEPGPGSKVWGYKVRAPFDSEREFFRQDPNTAGMAADDGRIVLNPYSDPKKVRMKNVAMNEAARLYMRETQPDLDFEVTPEQARNLRGTAYEQNPYALKETMIGRILSEDPSAGEATPHQQAWAKRIRGELDERDRIEKDQQYLAEVNRRVRQARAQQVINEYVAEGGFKYVKPGNALIGTLHHPKRPYEDLLEAFQKSGLIHYPAIGDQERNRERERQIEEFEPIMQRFLNPPKE